jgi:hypothetical protein
MEPIGWYSLKVSFMTAVVYSNWFRMPGVAAQHGPQDFVLRSHVFLFDDDHSVHFWPSCRKVVLSYSQIFVSNTTKNFQD